MMGADSHFDVHGSRKARGELDTLANDAVEPGQCERHRIGAGPQVNDLVLPCLIRDDDPGLLDEGRTRRFDRHARDDCAAGILHDAGNPGAALRVGSL